MDESAIKTTIYNWLSSELGTRHVFTISFNESFTLGNIINMTFNGESIIEVDALPAHADTIISLRKAIQGSSKILKCEISDTHELTCTAKDTGVEVLVTYTLTGSGITDPSATFRDIVDPEVVTVIIEDQNAPRPDYPYASFRISNINKIGFDEIRSIDSDTDVLNIGGQRRATVEINYFGQDSLSNLTKAYNSLEKQSLIDTFYVAGIAYLEKNDVQNLTDMLETKYEDRSYFDFYIGFADNIEDNVSIIESVSFTSNITSQGKDLDTDKITTGPISVD